MGYRRLGGGVDVIVGELSRGMIGLAEAFSEGDVGDG